MTEKQEKAILDALSTDRGSVHFVASDFDIAYIRHADSVLVQFCSGRDSIYEEEIRGTDYYHIAPEEAVAEIDRIAERGGFFKVCWHKQWGDCMCNRIA